MTLSSSWSKGVWPNRNLLNRMEYGVPNSTHRHDTWRGKHHICFSFCYAPIHMQTGNLLRFNWLHRYCRGKWCGREDRLPLRFTRFLPDSDTQKRTKQGCMYHRLYHRSWFAGRKMYARYVPWRGAPAGLRDKTICWSQRGRPCDLGVSRMRLRFLQIVDLDKTTNILPWLPIKRHLKPHLYTKLKSFDRTSDQLRQMDIRLLWIHSGSSIRKSAKLVRLAHACEGNCSPKGANQLC